MSEHQINEEDDAIRINLDFLADLNEADFDQFDRIMVALAGRTGLHPMELAALRYGDLDGHHHSPRLEKLSDEEWLPPVAASWFDRGERPTLVRIEAWCLGPRSSVDSVVPKESLYRRVYQALQRNVPWGENEPGADERWRETAYDPFDGYDCEPEKEEPGGIEIAERLKNVPAPPVVWAALELLAGGVPRTGLPVVITPDAENALLAEPEFKHFGICDHPRLREAADGGDLEAQRQILILAINNSLEAAAHLIMEFQTSNWRLRNRLEQAVATELRALLEAYADTVTPVTAAVAT